MREKENERESEREQVFEWLMANSLNSEPCPFLIKGMNFSFVLVVNNEQQVPLKHHQTLLTEGKTLVNLLQTSFLRLLGNLEPWRVTLEIWGPSVPSSRGLKKASGVIITK